MVVTKVIAAHDDAIRNTLEGAIANGAAFDPSTAVLGQVLQPAQANPSGSVLWLSLEAVLHPLREWEAHPLGWSPQLGGERVQSGLRRPSM